MCFIKNYGRVVGVLFFIVMKIQVPLFAQKKDTLVMKTLPDVHVIDKRPHVNNRMSVGQTMDSVQLKTIPAIQLSDALRFFSGVQIKDYGGVGGLKTISIRSLGANHTAVVYDGISVSDCQTGQVNLSRFSLENIETIDLNNDNGCDIFQPARLFASANVLMLHTPVPVFKENKPYTVKISFRGGSFNLFQPIVLIENKISKHLLSSFSCDYLYQKGDYPFKIQNGDSLISLKRTQADIQIYRLEETIFVPINSKQQLTAKLCYYHSEQGLPGAVILYNVSPSQRMWDENIAAQVHYENDIHEKLSFQTNVKWNYSYLRYLDTNYLNVEGILDNAYIQREMYVNNAVLYNPFKVWSLCLSNDLSLNTMSASLEDFVNPSRYTSLTALSTLLKVKRIQLSATLLHSYIYDLTSTTSIKKITSKFTPSIQFSYQPFKEKAFYCRAFYKQIFRMPTFNDMYYRLVGNVNLMPENAYQFDAGVSWSRYVSEQIPYLSLTADGYYNYIKDKIIAVPNKNLFIWSMINLGEVTITGVDVQAAVNWKITKKIDFETTLNYTFQHAVDISDKTTKNYKNQIPYTPKHTANGIFAFKTKWINVSYSLLFVGKRYVLGENIAENALQPYVDHGCAVFRSFYWKNNTLTLRLEVLNIADVNYEVVKNYPMVGRQFQGKITYNF